MEINDSYEKAHFITVILTVHVYDIEHDNLILVHMMEWSSQGGAMSIWECLFSLSPSPT